MKSRHIYIIGFFLLTLVAACKKNNDDTLKFGWASNGKIFIYNQHKGSSVVVDYLKLTIGNNQFFQNDVSFPAYMSILDNQFTITKEGLKGLACEDCRVGLFCNKFEFLYAPSNVSLNQELPQYSCGRTSVYTNRIIKADTAVTVPLGTFNTYIMQHQNGDKSYWNADNGIIMYEKVDPGDNRTVLETFKLSRVQ